MQSGKEVNILWYALYPVVAEVDGDDSLFIGNVVHWDLHYLIVP